MPTTTIELTAADGHKVSAYCARPSVPAQGAIVVLQEIFGVNVHIKKVAEQFRDLGYVAIAPALFDRVKRGVSLGYGPEDFGQAYALYQRLSVDSAILDVAAAVNYGTQFGRVGVVGYCFGGLLAWLAACKIPGVAAAVGYYGGGITDNMQLAPRTATMLHFGTLDQHVPIAPVREISKVHPSVAVHIYEADHGFNCNERPSFNSVAAELAMKRTTAFLHEHVGLRKS